MKYLTVTEVARRLRRNRQLILRWIADGRLTAERLGPVWAVREDVLSRFTPPPRKWSTRPKGRRRR